MTREPVVRMGPCNCCPTPEHRVTEADGGVLRDWCLTCSHSEVAHMSPHWECVLGFCDCTSYRPSPPGDRVTVTSQGPWGSSVRFKGVMVEYDADADEKGTR